MNKNIFDKFVSMVGPKRALFAPEDLITYGLDPYHEEGSPSLVLFPISTEEVSSILKLAYKENISVIPRGSGTNLAGATIPTKDSVVICLTHMTKILEINIQDQLARVEPGVYNYDFQKEVERHGLMYPPDPSSWKVATMGGTVGTNAGGPKTLKYGVTRDYLLGLTVVLANGDIIQTGGRTLKNVTGYDLTRFFCGSEGTLGIITEITVRLITKPKYSLTILSYFSSLETCSKCVQAIKRAGMIPTALELMDETVINLVEDHSKLGFLRDAKALLLVEIDGDQQTVEQQIKEVEAICTSHGATKCQKSSTEKDSDRLWAGRRAAFSVMARLKPNICIEDVTVPVSKLTHMMSFIKNLGEQFKIQIGMVAHAGDGNLHPFIVYDARKPSDVATIERIIALMFQETINCAGTLSGEHGIGLAKKKYLPLELSDRVLALTKQLKNTLDPKNILNPHKFVD